MAIRAIEDKSAETGAPTVRADVSGRLVAFDYLRAFAVVLVLCHHAMLAYTRYAFINIENPMANSKPDDATDSGDFLEAIYYLSCGNCIILGDQHHYNCDRRKKF